MSCWPREPKRADSHEQPAEPDSPGSQQVIGRYRATRGVRWYPAVFAVLWDQWAAPTAFSIGLVSMLLIVLIAWRCNDGILEAQG